MPAMATASMLKASLQTSHSRGISSTQLLFMSYCSCHRPRSCEESLCRPTADSKYRHARYAVKLCVIAEEIDFRNLSFALALRSTKRVLRRLFFSSSSIFLASTQYD